jgi:hypothetical protein
MDYLAADSYEAFVEEQIVVTDNILGAETGRPFRGVGGARERVERFSDHLRRALGVWPSPSHDTDSALIRTMVAATIIVRSHLAFASVTSPEAWPTLERVPFALLTLQKLAALAHETGMSRISYQTIIALLTAYRHFIRLASFSDCSFKWDPASEIRFSREKEQSTIDYTCYVRVMKALLSNGPTRLTLGQILHEYYSNVPIGRLASMELLSARLTGRLVPSLAPVRLSSRLSIRRWIFMKTPEDVLVRISDRNRPAADRAPGRADESAQTAVLTL